MFNFIFKLHKGISLLIEYIISVSLPTACSDNYDNFTTSDHFLNKEESEDAKYLEDREDREDEGDSEESEDVESLEDRENEGDSDDSEDPGDPNQEDDEANSDNDSTETVKPCSSSSSSLKILGQVKKEIETKINSVQDDIVFVESFINLDETTPHTQEDIEELLKLKKSHSELFHRGKSAKESYTEMTDKLTSDKEQLNKDMEEVNKKIEATKLDHNTTPDIESENTKPSKDELEDSMSDSSDNFGDD